MNALRPLIAYLARHRRPLGWGLVALIVTDALQLVAPWIFKAAIDGIDAGVNRIELARFAALLVGVSVLGGVARYFMRRLVIGTSREIEYEIRNEFFTHLTRLPFSYYNRTPTGDLLALATNDLNAVRMVVGPGVMYSVNTAITLTSALVLMTVLSWQLTLVAMIPLPLISLFMFRYGKVIHHRFQDVQEQFSAITARAQEYLSGVRVVKAYVQEDAARKDLDELNRRYLKGNMRLVKVDGLFSPAVGFLAGVGTLLVLWIGGILVIQDRITLGTFVAFNSYLVMLIWPMIALGWVVSIFQRGAASMKRISAVLEYVPELRDPEAGAPLPAFVTHPGGEDDNGVTPRGEIVFENVSYIYPLRPDVVVLRDIDLRVAPGETVAVVGRTGSGKTTLVNLVPRIFDPTEGRIRLDGVDLRDISLHELRRRIGVVPQETFLFSRTVRDNIALGRPEAAPERIEEIAELARLADDVKGFPRGYDTLVGERGVTLSGGQKQRTAIARAVLRDPDVLILDDSLSAVDTRTEDAILTGLASFMRNRTTILVAHRVSTLKLADRIVLIDDGRIAEQGTHDELMARNGAYADIVQRQQLSEELERTS